MDTSNFKEVFESPKVKTLTAQVAALEAEIVRLREATKLIVEAHDFGQFSDDFNQPQARSVRKAIRELCEALSTPFNPQALNELIEKVEKRTIERCAGVCKTLDREEKLHAAGYGPGYLTYTASDCEQIIRALPTGQIKLEELL